MDSIYEGLAFSDPEYVLSMLMNALTDDNPAIDARIIHDMNGSTSSILTLGPRKWRITIQRLEGQQQ